MRNIDKVISYNHETNEYEIKILHLDPIFGTCLQFIGFLWPINCSSTVNRHSTQFEGFNRRVRSINGTINPSPPPKKK